ncbi:PREDICTED: FHA domain-containing protein DDL isoform X2 [Theobroma cacao]|uniref:FHA domain-containing protein DDL isoform X2 n=1 Tax=Theobroma cacao TaxID=3641 RepID=A0AB32UXR6_THECC|nr:PREDICTED: FHA domain-containing protein DDL isoform X2 [Theobroma cacao]
MLLVLLLEPSKIRALSVLVRCVCLILKANLHWNRMGRNSSNHSESPVGRRGSPHRESPSNRERSPVRHKTSRRGSSPVRERSPSRRRSSRRDNSLEREKRSGHTKSPKHASSQSPISCSPSTRTKRLRRAQAEKEVEKVKEREYERNHSRGSEKSTHRDRASGKERNSEREMGVDRKERKSGRDDTNSKSARGRHDRSVSPSDRHHRSRHRSRSPASNSRTRDEVNNSRGAEQSRDDEYDSVSKMKAAEEALEAKQKQKPTFELSGKLAAETNRVRGVTLLFNEPPDARKPDIRWRLYVFKAGEVLNEPLYIHRQSCYLFGRERRVADIPTDHPSCSKQHAVIQFRQVEKEQPDGTLSKQVRPYIMDLGSTNKTFINDNPIEPQRYYELFEKDTIKFAESMFCFTRILPSETY